MVWVLAFWLWQAGPDELAEQGRELAAAGRMEEAAALWRKALGTAPNHYPSLFNLGFMAWQQKRDAAAVEWFARAAQAQPGEFNVLYLAGSASARQGKSAAAIGWWRKALAVQPANGKLRQAMAAEYARAKRFRDVVEVSEGALDSEAMYLMVIAARRALGEIDQTASLVKRALERFPDSARVQFEAGYDLHRAGQWQRSMPYFDRAIALEATYEEPHYYRGDALFRQDRHADAVGSFLEAIRMRPDYTLARVGLARAYLATGKAAQAAETLEEATRLDAANPQPYALLAQVYFRLGEVDKAQTANVSAQRLRAAR